MPNTITIDGVEYDLVQKNNVEPSEPVENEPQKTKYRPNGSLLERVKQSYCYYYIDTWAMIRQKSESDDQTDYCLHLTGNYFETREAVEKWQDKLLVAHNLKLKIDQINAENNWVVNWEDHCQRKHFVHWNNKLNAKDHGWNTFSNQGQIVGSEAMQDYLMSDKVSDDDLKTFLEVFSS